MTEAKTGLDTAIDPDYREMNSYTEEQLEQMLQQSEQRPTVIQTVDLDYCPLCGNETEQTEDYSHVECDQCGKLRV